MTLNQATHIIDNNYAMEDYALAAYSPEVQGNLVTQYPGGEIRFPSAFFDKYIYEHTWIRKI